MNLILGIALALCGTAQVGLVLLAMSAVGMNAPGMRSGSELLSGFGLMSVFGGVRLVQAALL